MGGEKMFAENIRILRTERGKSQQDLANYLQITRQAYSYYENGKRQPDYETLLKLGEYFNITIDELLNDDMSDRDENLVILNRNAKNLSPEKRKQLIDMAKLMFGEDWKNFNE